MKKNFDHFVNRVWNCLKQKRPTFVTREPLQPITATAPFELASLDFVHVERSSGGYEYIHVVVDHFTRYTQTYPTRYKSANTIAEKLFNEFIPRSGFPSRLHHNRGGEFENKLFQIDWNNRVELFTLARHLPPTREWTGKANEPHLVEYAALIT